MSKQDNLEKRVKTLESELRSLDETLAIVASPESRRGLEAASEDLAAGRTRSHAEVWGDEETPSPQDAKVE